MAGRGGLSQRVWFRLRERVNHLIASRLRRWWWTWQGCRIGAGTALPAVYMTWPHQVSLGKNCQIEHGVYFRFDGIWSPGPAIVIADGCFIGAYCEFNIQRELRIGAGSAIASGCKFIDHDHGITGEKLDETPGREGPIVLGRNVWLGVNVVVLKGVTIGDGAVVGAGAVVVKSIPAKEIWAGIPAVKIGVRPAAGHANESKGA